MVEVTQADREAAISGYYAWCSGNPVIPNKIASGVADDQDKSTDVRDAADQIEAKFGVRPALPE